MSSYLAYDTLRNRGASLSSWVACWVGQAKGEHRMDTQEECRDLCNAYQIRIAPLYMQTNGDLFSRSLL